MKARLRVAMWLMDKTIRIVGGKDEYIIVCQEPGKTIMRSTQSLDFILGATNLLMESLVTRSDNYMVKFNKAQDEWREMVLKTAKKIREEENSDAA